MKEASQICVDKLNVIEEDCRRTDFLLSKPGFCIKFYREVARVLKRKERGSDKAEVLVGQSCRWLNINWKKWFYRQSLRKRLPPDLFSVFPEYVEPVYSPERGWGVVESLVVNTDGSLSKKIFEELPQVNDLALRVHVYREVERIIKQMAKHTVRFFDPSSLVLQWTSDATFKIRSVDFEPCSRGGLPLIGRLRPFVRLKILQDMRRYLERLQPCLPPEAVPSLTNNNERGRELMRGQNSGRRFFARLARMSGLI